jgi:hypothetical protein
MRAVVDAAAAHRTPHARAEHMLTGFVDLAVRHRKLTAMLGADQAIARLLEAQAHFEDLVERPLALLGGTVPTPPAGSTRRSRCPASRVPQAANCSATWTTTRSAST